MKSVLISIHPKWCDLIASGKKTIEVRRTRPKIETPFKCYIYCTKPKMITKYVFRPEDYPEYMRPEKTVFCKAPDASSPFCSEVNGNSKVIGEFVCDCITPLYNVCTDDWILLCGGLHEIEKQLAGMACLTEAELHKYANGKHCFAWYISDLKIYDKPKELSEFYRVCDFDKCDNCQHLYVENTPSSYETWCEFDEKIPITRPPQSWCYVEEV